RPDRERARAAPEAADPAVGADVLARLLDEVRLAAGLEAEHAEARAPGVLVFPARDPEEPEVELRPVAGLRVAVVGEGLVVEELVGEARLDLPGARRAHVRGGRAHEPEVRQEGRGEGQLR